jgi:hypothetical protein
MYEAAGGTLISKVVGSFASHIVALIFGAEMIIQEEPVALGSSTCTIP